MAGWGRRRAAIMTVGLLIPLSACATGVAGSGVAASSVVAPAASAAATGTSRSAPATIARSTPPRSPSTVASTVAPTPSSPAGGARYEPPAECLLTVAQVSDVLGGRWSRDDTLGAGACLYSSDRGAALVIGPVDYAPDELTDALAEVRVTTCDTDPVDVPGADGAFVCVQFDGDTDYIQGNLIVDRYFWLFQILGSDPQGDYSAEIDALVALMSSVPR
ncbi:hypothetical protein [Nakamurella sp.]|uniref:hypothetical protein n=1 Tax=Nakamurella sp. TaxID=1869182 RepID=UPI003B3B0F3E